MSTIFASFLLGAFIIVPTEWPEDYVWGEGGSYWGLVIPDEILGESKWSDQGSNPPISIREALAIVNKHLKKARGEAKAAEWELHSIKLISRHLPEFGKEDTSPRWYYIVILKHLGPGSGSIIKYIAGITMDGKLVEPTNLGTDLPKLLKLPENLKSPES